MQNQVRLPREDDQIVPQQPRAPQWQVIRRLSGADKRAYGQLFAHFDFSAAEIEQTTADPSPFQIRIAGVIDELGAASSNDEREMLKVLIRIESRYVARRENRQFSV